MNGRNKRTSIRPPEILKCHDPVAYTIGNLGKWGRRQAPAKIVTRNYHMSHYLCLISSWEIDKSPELHTVPIASFNLSSGHLIILRIIRLNYHLRVGLPSQLLWGAQLKWGVTRRNISFRNGGKGKSFRYWLLIELSRVYQDSSHVKGGDSRKGRNSYIPLWAVHRPGYRRYLPFRVRF